MTSESQPQQSIQPAWQGQKRGGGGGGGEGEINAKGNSWEKKCSISFPPFSPPPDSPPLSIRHLPRQQQRVPISQHSAGGCLSGISNICFGKLQMQPPCEQTHTKTPLWRFNKIACSVLISHPVDK